MARIGVEKAHKGGRRPESFYTYITARFLSRSFVPILIKIGIRQPNAISVLSFAMVLTSAVLFLFLEPKPLFNRIAIALLIEFSFILDCSDGQVARTLNRITLFGGWLDKYMDRIGEMFLYTVIGYVSWMRFGHFLYFILGFSTGFLFTYYSLIWAMKDSVFLEELRNSDYNLERYRVRENERKGKINRRVLGRRFLKKNTLSDVLSMVFFFLNIGMGERYFYPILFIILNRTDLMLIVVSVLFFMRSMNVTFILIRQIMRGKIGVRID